MNDTMNDTMGDDDVIARVRSALDEVAATGTSAGTSTDDGLAGPPDSDAAPVITLRTDAVGHRPTRAWLGIAAATAVLVGAGGWVLTQRSTPQTTTAGTAVDTTAALPVAPSGPWFELQLADAVAGPVQSSALDADEGGFTQSWVVTRPNDAAALGVLDIRVRYDEDGLGATADPNAFVPVAAPQGSAWSATDPMSAGGFALVWQRGDGTVWWVSQAGMIDPSTGGAAGFAEYVFQIQRGTFNDLLTNPDQQAEWVRATPAGAFVDLSQSYEVGSQSAGVVLAVTGAPLLSVLAGTTDLTEVMVAGNRGWTGTRPDGEVTVVWLVDTDRWGLLRISPLLTDRVDEIIESVTLVATGVGEPLAVATTTLPPTEPTALPGPSSDVPSFVLDGPGLTPEMTNGAMQVGTGDQRLRVAGWTVDQAGVGASPAYVVGTALDWGGMPYDADGVNYLDVSRNGVTAVLDLGIDSSGVATLAPKVYLPQPDGIVWTFQAVGLLDAGDTPHARLVDLAFALGDDAFAAGVDPANVAGVVAISDGPLPTTEYGETYRTAAGGTVAMVVSDGTTLGELRDAVSITPTKVLDRPAWIARFPGGNAVVIWQVAEGSRWWASLRFSDAATAVLVDDVLAAVQPAPPAP